MRLDILLFYLFLYKAAFIKGCHGNNVILSSQSLDLWENTDVTLTCTYTCTNGSVHTVTLKNITQQRHGEMWKCVIEIGTLLVPSNTLQILVKVPVKSTTITPSMNDVFTTKENISWSFVCKTSECRPEPKFLWYKQASTQSDGGETIITETVSRNSSDVKLQSYNHTYNPIFNRTWNNWTMYCGASNRNDRVVLSRKILINITYPPDGPPRIGLYQNGTTIKIIKNTSLDLVCSITGGNPLPRLEWNQAGGSFTQASNDTVTNTISWQAADNNRHDLVFQSAHQHKNDLTYVTLEVFYPPEGIDVSLIIDTDNTSSINRNFSVIENTSITMLLICSARSNPSPNSYRWTGPIHSNSARLEINLTRHVRGTYTCHINNTMIAYDGRTEQGYNNLPYIVEILPCQLPTFNISTWPWLIVF